MTPTPIIALAVAALLLTACASEDSSSAPSATDQTTTEQFTTPQESTAESAPGVSVVTTTTMLGDVTRQITDCAGGTVTVLMPVGSDPHDFSASSEQVAEMVNADVVVVNGLGLEAGLTDSLENATADGARLLEIAPLVDPIEFGAGGHSDEKSHSDGHAHADEGAHSDEEGHSDGHDHGSLDPHFWMDMNRMAMATELIGNELTEVTGDDAYTTCAATTATQIRDAELEVRALLESVPADKRILVTDHDSLGYLADTYGYEVAGTVIPSGSTLAQPSSADLADLVATITAEGVTVIFTDVSQTTSLAEAVAAETGSDIAIIQLYEGSLGGPDSPAATYIDMMRTNATLISEGLQG